jgi:two-component system CheB/CheR fusion protein
MEKQKIVGIGSSAGGLEALQHFVKNIPTDTNLSFIIAQHLDPSQPSLLINILSKSSTIDIKEAKQGERPKPNTIYICPPNNNIAILNEKISLTPPNSKIYPKPSIDTFFSSLAKELGENAIGIILSGTGSDGAQGIKAIKYGGGITIVQDERSAKYSSMPRASIDTGCVDAVLPSDIIAKELKSIISSPNIFFINENAPKNLDTIYDILLERLNIDFTDYKINTIQRRIHRRMAVNKITSLEEYVEYLKKSPKEAPLLYKDLLVIVTSFFRDLDAFYSLDNVIRQIVDNKNRNDNIRVWIPGCATGEEVISIAILLHKELVNQNKLGHIKVQIFATDVSDEAISEARNAKYFKEEIAQIPQEYIKDYFVKKDDLYEVSKSIRDLIIFSKHDLIKDPPFISLDLISCRNLLIYFNSTLQKRLFGVFHHSLKLRGFLFLGKSESTSGLTSFFRTVDSKWKIFQKEETLNPPKLEYLQYYPKRYPTNINIEEIKKDKVVDKNQVLNDAITGAVLQFFAKDYIIIDKDNAIIYTSGNIKQYFDIPIGKMSTDILSFAREDIRIDLRSAIYRSRREQTTTTQKVHQSEINNIYISTVPLPNSDYYNDTIMVMFSEIEESDETKSNITISERERYEIEHELLVTKERLQTTIEELETTNEELQSTNEELQSANEELRSTNEELETSNEELQSANEELSTVNDELEIKSRDLRETNDDLVNAFRTIDYGVVFIDKYLRIRRYTPFMKNIFNIKIDDIGSLLTSIECKIDFPELKKHLTDVIENSKSKHFEFQDGGFIYYCHIKPFFNEQERVSGAILTFLDKTEITKKEKELDKYKNYLEEIIEEKTHEIISKDAQFKVLFEHIAIGVIKTDDKGNILEVNSKFCEMLGYTKKEMLSMNVLDIKDEQSINIIKSNIKETITYETQIPKKDNSKIWINSTISVFTDITLDKKFYIKTIEDISDKKEMQEEITKLNINLKNEIEKQVKEIREKEQLLVQQSKMASMGEMIGAIAHQWRQPLNTLSIRKDALIDSYYEKDIDDSVVAEFDEKSSELIKYMSKTIDDFRNFFMPSKEKDKFDIIKEVDTAIYMINAQLHNNHIEIKKDYEYEYIYIYGYKNEFKQVLINIINNAKDAIINNNIQNGIISIKIYISNSRVTIDISDNAGGIAEDIINKIFEPYFTTKFNSQGTGLGLYMAKTIIEKNMDGILKVENTNSGAKFTIELAHK